MDVDHDVERGRTIQALVGATSFVAGILVFLIFRDDAGPFPRLLMIGGAVTALVAVFAAPKSKKPRSEPQPFD